MASIRRVVHHWWTERGFDTADTDEQLDRALSLLAGSFAEDKIAGILVIAERLLDEVTLEHVDRLAEPYELGLLPDWATCDWFAFKVLVPFVGRVEGADDAIAAWVVPEHDLWYRRGGAVALIGVATERVDLVRQVAEVNAADPARFSQTSVGWLLREMRKQGGGDDVDAILDALPHLSREARTMATTGRRRRGREAGRRPPPPSS